MGSFFPLVPLSCEFLGIKKKNLGDVLNISRFIFEGGRGERFLI